LSEFDYRTLLADKKARSQFLFQQNRIIKLLTAKGFVEAALIHARKRKQLIEDFALLADD